MPPRLAHERTAAICTIVIAAHLAQPHRGSQPTLVMDMGSPALKVRAAYSYRDDTAVPRFDDSSPIVFMDGQCALCTRAARLICKFDRRNVFKISPTASDLGRAILAHYGLNCENPASWLYLEEGKAYGSMEAVIRVGTRLGGRWRSVALLRLLPPRARDWLYRWLAANRYRLFGRADMCAAPDPELRRRLLL
jgi:predicted DCC family thiol-disulfide oxidoreductase YuxK